MSSTGMSRQPIGTEMGSLFLVKAQYSGCWRRSSDDNLKSTNLDQSTILPGSTEPRLRESVVAG